MTYFADNALIDLGLCFVFGIGPHKRASIQNCVFSLADLPGLIQKLIIPTDQRRSKSLQMTGLSLDLRLPRVSAAVEILPRPHSLAARLRNVHWNQIFDCGSQLERGELRSAWQRHRHVHMV